MSKKSYESEKVISIIIIVVSLVLLVAAAVYFLAIGESFGKENIKMEIMPNIVGYKLDDVNGCYSRFFTVNITGDEFSDYEDGTILTQSIPENQKYEAGKTVVQVTISKGSKPVETTAPPIETTAPPETEPPLETGLTVDEPTFDFMSYTPSDTRLVLTCGIDETNADVKAKLDELGTVLFARGCDGGFMYVDLITGASAEFNANEKFNVGSIIKAPYVRSVLGQSLDLGAKYEMTNEMLNSPTELIDGQPVGTEFTVEELVNAAISQSDNTAYKMLFSNLGFDNFNTLSSNLGLSQQMTADNSWFRMTSRDTACYFTDIYFFMEQHQNGALLKNALLNAEHNNLVSDELAEYDVCEKYGYMPQEGFYTLGSADIVYADNPYALIVYVRGTGTTLNTQFFHNVARLTDELNTLLHA